MPGKATYLLFESRPDIEFDYYLSDRLRMTVSEMRRSMSGEEYQGWITYHKRKAQQEELARLKAG